MLRPLRKWKIHDPWWSGEATGEYPYWSYRGCRADSLDLVHVTASRTNTNITYVSVEFVLDGKIWYQSTEYKDKAVNRENWTKGVKRAANNILKKMRASKV